AAVALLSGAGIDARPVSSPEAAEVSGAVGPAVRATLAGLANQIRTACARMGLDPWEVFGASGTESPPTFDASAAPALFTWGVRQWGASTELLDRAAEINRSVPGYVITRLADALNDAGKAVRGSKVAILGMAHKKDVDDPRESPGFELLNHLLKKGAAVSYNDPHIPSLPRMHHWSHLEPMHSQPLTAEYLAAQDCVLIATDHTAYDYDFIVRHSKLVIDTRNATRAITRGREKIVRV
ncbi:MAG: nucleotide sugar dehydrogenase, partial [Planctomycetes bacterium]|nr:nucleotide sugar dehydrogenase [Planctomycetota bacterium]